MSLPIIPTLEELLHPETQPKEIREKALASEDPLDPINLFRISWRNDNNEFEYHVLPPELTGVEAPIVVMCAHHFPTGSHKVGPVLSCVREKILDGELEDNSKTLVFPSTGNYGIGGAWVGPRMNFPSLVILPEEMSAERFEKIREYGADVIATPGCESNVKEIYDKVNELRKDPQYLIINQFEEFGNYRFHYHVTGNSALELAEELKEKGIGDGTIAAFVSAMGSAGTIAAGDNIKSKQPQCKIVGVEPIQCPTLFSVGYGGHAIEGIGDKHVTWIHNVRNMDLLICIDDQDSLKGLQLLQEGRDVLAKELNIPEEVVNAWDGMFGISTVCNILASIKAAHYWEFDSNQVILTIATDGFDRYPSVMRRLDEKYGKMDEAEAKRRIDIFRKPRDGWTLEGTQDVRRRWHNQKYFTWVEQQGKTIPELNAQLSPSYWKDIAASIPELDKATLALRNK